MTAPVQQDMFRAAPTRAPVMIALGMGVDSVAMTIEMFERGMPIDQVLFADTGSERPETYEYEAISDRPMEERPAFKSWLDFFDAHGGLFQGDGARALYGESYQDMRQAVERVKDEA